MSEEWCPVDGFPHYEVSSLGRIRSLPRVVRFVRFGIERTMKKPGVILKQGKDKNGYRRVSMYDEEGHFSQGYLHRLVARTFIGPCPEGQQIRHLDGNVNNNTASNLSYGTAKQNQSDKRNHGTHIEGERHYKAKLTEEDVRAIRRDYVRRSLKFGAKALGRKYGVCDLQIKNIIDHVSWKHVQ